MKIKLFLLTLTIMVSSCAIQPAYKNSGITNLENKSKNLKTGLSNKNDVIGILGETILKEFPEENLWLYYEKSERKNFYGKKVVDKSNHLILEFNDKGILVQKKFLYKEDLKNLEFTEEITKIYSLESTITRRFFTSMRKRFINKSNTSAN